MDDESRFERELAKARVTTTPEQDQRILAGARRALHRPRSLRGILMTTLPAAACLLVLAGLPLLLLSFMAGGGGGGGGGGGYDQDFDLEIAKMAAEHPEDPETGLFYPGSLQTTYGEFVVQGSSDLDGMIDLRGLGGEDGPLVNLGDVTNGLEDGESHGFDRRYVPGTEEYDRLVLNPWLDPRAVPLSTFGIDVDTASYANVRRFLTDGQLPPFTAVRLEELVNYFDYDYPPPEGDAPFSVSTEVAVCPWAPRRRLVRIGLMGRRVDLPEAPPVNLVFLLDVSGSMEPEDKLPLVKNAMQLLAGTLRPQDRVGIVTYASESGVALATTAGSEKLAIREAIGKLTANGSTNGAAGIQTAYELARKGFLPGGVNRVILATDGDFNVGVTDRADLEALITREREGGVFLTVLGVGTDNLKDSQIEMLADKGNGNYAYLDSILEAEKVLLREAGATFVPIAKDVKIQVEFNPARVGAYRLLGYENRLLAARDFADDTVDAGEIGAGHSVTALYEIVSPDELYAASGVDPLKYQREPEREPAGPEDEILTLKLRYKAPDGDTSRLLEFPLADPGRVAGSDASTDFHFASAVAAFALKLRGARDGRALDWSLIREIAAGARGEDPHGERKEFLDLLDRAAALDR